MNGMTVWFLGDAEISADVAAFAASLGADLIDSSTAGATMEHVWVEQLYDPGIREVLRRRRGRNAETAPIVVVVWLNLPDYDSEATLGRLKSVIPEGTRILYLVPESASINTLDGFTHYDDPLISHAVLGTKTLTELYDESPV